MQKTRFNKFDLYLVFTPKITPGLFGEKEWLLQSIKAASLNQLYAVKWVIDDIFMNILLPLMSAFRSYHAASKF